MTALNLNNYMSFKFEVYVSKMKCEDTMYFVFLFPYLLNIEWILKLQT